MRVALLALLAACTIENEHHLEVAWTIDRFGDGSALTADGLPGERLACPAGWTTVRLVAVDPAAPATRIVDTFPCDAQQGTSSLLPRDAYVAWLEVADGDKVLATTPPTPTDVTSFDPLLVADIYVDAGYVTVAPTARPISLSLTNGSITSSTTFGGGVFGPFHAGPYESR